MAEDDGEGGATEGSGSLPANIIAEEDGLYQIKGVDIYPVSHPDLSTQPSVLPQRFGKEKIYEVLVSTKQEKLISTTPSDSSNMPSYTQSGPIESLGDHPQAGGQISANDADITLGYYSGLLALVDSAGNAVTPSGGWFVLSNPSYQFGTLTPRDSSIWVYPLYDDAYPGCFRYFVYTTGTSNELYYAKIIVEDGVHWHVENTTLYEIANDGINVYNITLDPEIPSTATIIEASSFNSEACVPAICKKENGKWTITNNEGITPDFTLVRYIGETEDYYYENSGSSSDSDRTIIKSFDIPFSTGSDEWPTDMNVPDIWGNDALTFETGQIVGKVIVYYSDGSNLMIDLFVVNNGSSVKVGASSDGVAEVLQLDLYRIPGSSPMVTAAPPHDIHIDFYAL